MKNYLLLAGALLASASVNAGSLAEPLVMPGMVITAVSANGEWAASSDDANYIFSVIDIKNNQVYTYSLEADGMAYSGGMGCYVSNNGVVVASGLDELGYYWANGNWTPLPAAETDYQVFPIAITPDGSVIVGNVSHEGAGLDDDKVMTSPVIWRLGDNGRYGMYEELPFPTTDWTGRTPQYFLADDISADGTVIACDLCDYSGVVQEPWTITLDGDAWKLNAIHPELLNPDGIEFPPYPGEFTMEEPNPIEYMSDDEAAAYQAALDAYNNAPYPEYTDFMSPEELAAYQAALNAYLEDEFNNPYPDYFDFMTEEELDAYQTAIGDYYSREYPDATDYMSADELADYEAAMAVYDKAFEEWMPLFSDFKEAFYGVLENMEVPSYSMNSARISPDGNLMLMNAEMLQEDEMSWWPTTASVPYVFDLAGDEYYPMTEGESDVLATQIFNDGRVLGATPSNEYARTAVLADSPSDPFVKLLNIIETSDPTLAEWMQENMGHEVPTEVYDPDLDDFVFVTSNEIISGTPVASADMATIGSWTFNVWDMDDENMFYSYLLPTEVLSGIRSISADKALSVAAHLAADGTLTIAGRASKVEIYDVNGRVVFSADNPAAVVRTGLNSGIYLVKATAADSKRAAISKAAI